MYEITAIHKTTEKKKVFYYYSIRRAKLKNPEFRNFQITKTITLKELIQNLKERYEEKKTK